MMDPATFRRNAHRLADWMADFYENIEKYPVKSPVKPREILEKLPAAPPENGESFDAIFRDFENIVVPGMTHWQHPSFFAFFPANGSYPSVLAEMLTAALGAQCMMWETSPAAAELEERMMDWLRQALGLPQCFEGVIQDTASTATLCSILTAREQISGFSINEAGFRGDLALTVYCSTETHSSIEKAVRIAGLGTSSLRKIPVDESFALRPVDLEKTIRGDLQAGRRPCCVVATLGTTGSTAIDPLRPIGEICKEYGIWLHVDAALAGTALVLPEYRWMIDGMEYADTFVFNPHKWMFTNFDCSAYFVRDRDALVRTFEIHPEYLKTREESRVNNYRDWGIQLGRRFRALKLWFVMRTYGIEGIRETLRRHLSITRSLVDRIQETPDFELSAPAPLNTVCFRYAPDGFSDPEVLNELNELLLERLNGTGKVYFTHTLLRDAYVIRFVIGQTTVASRHVDRAWDLIAETAPRVADEIRSRRSAR